MSNNAGVSPLIDYLKDWTSEECLRYLHLYQFYPKNFSKISAGIGTKTTKECVFFYYHRHLSKIELLKAIRKGRRPDDAPTPKATPDPVGDEASLRSVEVRRIDSELEPISCTLPEECRLGCVCPSLAGESENYGQDNHCQHPECIFRQECLGKYRRNDLRSQNPVTRSCQKLVWPVDPDSNQILELNNEKFKKLQLNGSSQIQRCNPAIADTPSAGHLNSTKKMSIETQKNGTAVKKNCSSSLQKPSQSKHPLQLAHSKQMQDFSETQKKGTHVKKICLSSQSIQPPQLAQPKQLQDTQKGTAVEQNCLSSLQKPSHSKQPSQLVQSKQLQNTQKNGTAVKKMCLSSSQQPSQSKKSSQPAQSKLIKVPGQSRLESLIGQGHDLIQSESDNRTPENRKISLSVKRFKKDTNFKKTNQNSGTVSSSNVGTVMVPASTISGPTKKPFERVGKHENSFVRCSDDITNSRPLNLVPENRLPFKDSVKRVSFKKQCPIKKCLARPVASRFNEKEKIVVLNVKRQANPVESESSPKRPRLAVQTPDHFQNLTLRMEIVSRDKEQAKENIDSTLVKSAAQQNTDGVIPQVKVPTLKPMTEKVKEIFTSYPNTTKKKVEMPDNDINAILVRRNFVKKSSAEERVKIDESLNEQIMPPGVTKFAYTNKIFDLPLISKNQFWILKKFVSEQPATCVFTTWNCKWKFLSAKLVPNRDLKALQEISAGKKKLIWRKFNYGEQKERLLRIILMPMLTNHFFIGPYTLPEEPGGSTVGSKKVDIICLE